MLRPATPLTVLLFVAFILLLVSVISTPIVKGIPLASFQGVDLGVFGYCKGRKCSKIQVGYSTNTQTLFGSEHDKEFSLPSSARSSLSSILIVHPIAALLTLICFILAALAHLHAPSHSPRYLLALLILLLPTLLITLLAFLVDILLFVPHLAWGGWIVLGSTILITASGVVTCAMRRTLVSRKARKKRIAENAEMNGENYYSRQNTIRAESPPPLDTETTPVMVNGAPGADHLPAFATFDAKNDRVADDERIPLNTRTPSNRTLPSNGIRLDTSEDGSDRYAAPRRGGPAGMRGGRSNPYNGPRDEFGNPLPSSNAFGPAPLLAMRRGPSESGIIHRYSNETMNSQASRGRGRGGYPPRGYGRGVPYGPSRGPSFSGNGRGVSMAPVGIGPGPAMRVDETGKVRQDGPPPGYGNGYPPQGRGMPGQYNREIPPGPGGPAIYGRDQSAPGYGRRSSPGPPSATGAYGRQPSPGPPSASGAYRRQPSPGPPSAPVVYGTQHLPDPPSVAGAYSYTGRQPSPGPLGAPQYRAESPPPPIPEIQQNEGHTIGQAVEMDAYTGSPSHTPLSNRPMQLGEGDHEAQRVFMLQQQQHRESPISLTSVYSTQDAYVPPRAAWAAGTGRSATPQNATQPLSPIQPSPIELPTESPSPSPAPQPFVPTHIRINSADNYYEDVDPRFADPEPLQPLPASLMPGSTQPNSIPHQPINRNGSPAHLQPSSSYESIPEGSRSHTSDASHFTSISQRGINPNWRPSPGPQEMGTGVVPDRRPMQRQQQQQQDVLLQSNPDFELPGAARGGRMLSSRGDRGGGRAPGMIPGMGSGSGGRYPGSEI